jgi:multisubunit Na+/H+ antiporter MnhB subunit
MRFLRDPGAVAFGLLLIGIAGVIFYLAFDVVRDNQGLALVSFGIAGILVLSALICLAVFGPREGD